MHGGPWAPLLTVVVDCIVAVQQQQQGVAPAPGRRRLQCHRTGPAQNGSERACPHAPSSSSHEQPVLLMPIWRHECQASQSNRKSTLPTVSMNNDQSIRRDFFSCSHHACVCVDCGLGRRANTRRESRSTAGPGYGSCANGSSTASCTETKPVSFCNATLFPVAARPALNLPIPAPRLTPPPHRPRSRPFPT
jgi:hypothetical protein